MELVTHHKTRSTAQQALGQNLSYLPVAELPHVDVLRYDDPQRLCQNRGSWGYSWPKIIGIGTWPKVIIDGKEYSAGTNPEYEY